MENFRFDIQRFEDVVLTEGNDTYTNDASYVRILALGGDDSIDNTSENVTIDGGAGNDTITNSGDDSKIDGGAGNDRITLTSTGNLVSYAAGGGNDTIIGFNESDTLTITGGDYSTQESGDDVIITVGDGSILLVGVKGKALNINNSQPVTNTITLTEGDDTLQTKHEGKSILALGGNDSIYVYYGSNMTIDGGDGDDSIFSGDGYGGGAIINGGQGNDSITNDGDSATIDGGEGDDRITLTSTGNLISYAAGDGNDTIIGFNESDTLTITGGAYSTQESGDDVIITVGDGSILLIGAKGKALNINDSQASTNVITLTEGDDTLRTDLDNITIQALGGNDFIFNDGGDNVSISGGAGNDSIYNDYGYRATIDGGAGYDTIFIYNSDVIIDAGDGNDYIYTSYGYIDDNTINGGAGDDTIFIYNSDVIIDAGDGNDLIYSDNFIYYSATINGGAGDDTIENEGNNATIDGGAGNDHIDNYGNSNVTIDGGAGNDTISNDDNSNVTIDGGAGDDQISLTNVSNLIIYTAGDGNDTVYGFNESDPLMIIGGEYSTQESSDDILVTVGDGSILLVGAKGKALNINDSQASTNTITLSEGDDTLRTDLDNVSILALGGNDSIYNYYGSDVSIDAGAGSDTISNSGYWVTIDGGDGNDSIYNDGYKVLIDGGDGDDYISNSDDNSTINGGEGDDFIRNYRDNMTLIYNLGDGDDTINGFNETSTLQVSGGTYSSQVSGVDVIITVGNGSVLLVGAATLDNLNIEGESEPVWKIKGTTATYTSAQGKTLATVTGLKKNLTANDLSAGISVEDNVITLSAALLSTSKVAVKEKGYTLALGDDVAEPEESEPTWKVSGTKATLSDGTSEGYTLSKDARSITYSAAKAGKAIATISGLKKGTTEDSIDFDGETITLSANALGTSKVTLKGDGYALALGDGVKISEQAEAPEWNVSGTKATLNVTTSDGYSCDGSTITYSKNEKTAAVVTLTGLTKNLTAKDVNAAVTVEDNVITLSADILGTTKVAVKEKGYTLALGDDVDEPEPVENTWIISGTKATLSDGTSAGYTLSKDARSITYTAAKATGKAKATISGLKKSMAADDIELYGEKIIIYNDALGTSKVTLKGDYVFAMGYDVDPVEYKDYDWSLNTKKQTATFKANMKAGYVLSDDKKTITYSKAKTGVTIATITGVTDTSGLEFDGETLTLSGDSLTDKVTVSGNVAFEFGDDFNDGTITGSKAADIITVNGTGVTINAGKGDDKLTTAGGNTFVYASGDGDDVIADFTEKDRIQITKGTPKVTADDTDVKVTVGKGSITLSDAAGQTISILDKKGNETTYETTAAADNNPYWFIDDDFTTTPQLADITAEADCMLGEMDFNDAMQLVQTTPIVTASDKK